MVGVTITYRLAPEHPWPAGAQDVGQAVAWVTEHISGYGGDRARMVVAGHSAGAAHVAGYLAGHAGSPVGIDEALGVPLQRFIERVGQATVLEYTAPEE
jgi:acetyl esterase/lipase